MAPSTSDANGVVVEREAGRGRHGQVAEAEPVPACGPEAANVGARGGGRQKWLVLLPLLAAVLVTAGRAGACVPQPNILVQPRASGPAGTEVEVKGENFGAASAEVRWNAVDGTLLAKANGPSFAAHVVVPADVAPGLYTLVVLLRGPQAELVDAVRSPFEVTGTAVPATTPARAATEPSTPGSSSSPVGAGLTGAAIALVAGLAGTRVGRSRERRSSGSPPPTG